MARLLVERGAWFDIFIAVGLRDAALVERCLRDDPEALDHRTGRASTPSRTTARRAATREEIGDRRGDIYRWVFDHNISAIEAAAPARLRRHRRAAARVTRRPRSGCSPRARRRIAPPPRPSSRRIRASSPASAPRPDAAHRRQGARQRHRGRRADARPRLRCARDRARQRRRAPLGGLPRQRRDGAAAAAAIGRRSVSADATYDATALEQVPFMARRQGWQRQQRGLRDDGAAICVDAGERRA